MNITIFAVGRERAGPFHDLMHDYMKRMNWTCRLKEIQKKDIHAEHPAVV